MSALVFENYWQNKAACDDAERAYYQKLSGCKVDNLSSGLSASEEMALMKKLGDLEVENKSLKKGKKFVFYYDYYFDLIRFSY